MFKYPLTISYSQGRVPFKIVLNPETAILLSRQEGREGRMPKGDLSCEGQRANLMFLHYACMRAFAKEIMEKANSFDKWNASRRRKKRSVSLENRAPSAEGKRRNLIIGPPRARESPTPLTFFGIERRLPVRTLTFSPSHDGPGYLTTTILISREREIVRESVLR